jgi:hypothetical protein
LSIDIVSHKLYPTVPDGRPELTVSGGGRGVRGPVSGIPLYRLVEGLRGIVASSGGRVVIGLMAVT